MVINWYEFMGEFMLILGVKEDFQDWVYGKLTINGNLFIDTTFNFKSFMTWGKVE